MRKALIAVAVVLGLLLALVLAGVVFAQRALTQAGIEELRWQGLRVTGGGLQVAQLTGRFVSEQGQLAFALSDLRLVPGGESRLRLAEAGAERLTLDWHALAAEAPETDAVMPDPLAWAESLDWLPDHLYVRDLLLNLPCPTGECRAQGDLNLFRTDAGLNLQLELLTDEGPLELLAQVQTAAQSLTLQAQLHVAGEPALLLDSTWSEREEVPHWLGRLQVPDWPHADWLIDYVALWVGPAGLPFSQLPSGLQADLAWDLLPEQWPQQWLDFLAGSVQLQARAQLPQVWRWPELGDLEGEVALDIVGDHGRWQLGEGLANLTLTQPTLAVLAELPQTMRPTRISLRVQPESGSALDWASALPFAVQLNAAGPVEMGLAGRVVVATQPTWQAEWDQLLLTARAASFAWNDLLLRDLNLNLPFAGRVDAEQLSMRLGSGAVLRAASLSETELDLALRGVRLNVPGMQLLVPLDEPALATARGRLEAVVDNLAHALLKPQSWTFNGELDYSAERMGWRGSASAASGLVLDLGLAVPTGRPWSAEATLQEVFLRAANPLAATFADWPPLLSFASGRLTGQFKAGGVSGLDQLQGQLKLTGGRGIYDRLTFEGLTTVMDVSLKGDDLLLRLPDLRVDELDPGMPLGPLGLNMAYRAALSSAAAGKLELLAGQLGMLGGKLRVNPAILDLAATRQSLVVELEGIELTRLFEVYPAEGLSGRGTLDGRLPVSLEDGKLLIDSGQLQAREPGGFLRYRSDKLKDLARTNIGMRQVADALDDFHYSVLASDVAYDQDGLLMLGLQLQGRNPALEGGRPIHLNIQLEENIPALLASLQLSGQVSDIIQKRVQERLLQRRLAPDP